MRRRVVPSVYLFGLVVHDPGKGPRGPNGHACQIGIYVGSPVSDVADAPQEALILSQMYGCQIIYVLKHSVPTEEFAGVAATMLYKGGPNVSDVYSEDIEAVYYTMADHRPTGPTPAEA